MGAHEHDQIPPPPDPLIDDVRAIRNATCKECSNDLRLLHKRLEEPELLHAEQAMTGVEKTIRPKGEARGLASATS